jgi:hypothetical protein
MMARRYAEAESDFASPILNDDPSAAMWRGYDRQQDRPMDDANQRSRRAPAP